ncbi:hypothetical protein C2S51_026888 [Perilla frutescens var. frutescens]|nr:hypothetical protein C2S51_026888 [Perilla frutescens var. frutescens]
MALPDAIDSTQEILDAQTHVWNLIFNYINSMSLKCALQLGIPDIIHKHDKPITLSQLADALPINKAKSHGLYRLMRTLVHSKIFEKVKIDGEEEEAYSLTRASRLLLRDEPLSLSFAPFALAMIDPIMMDPFHHLMDWFQDECASPFITRNGRDLWEFGGNEKKWNQLFNDAMASDARFIASILVKECNHVFEGLKTMVDVAGGTGAVAKAVAASFPAIKCTVLDLPQVVAGLKGSENLSFVSGDMFVFIPPADAVFLKRMVRAPKASSIHSLLFTNRRSLKFINISVAFRRECKKTRGNSVLSLKLAYLFILYAVVLPRDRKEKSLQMQYLHLADDLEQFEKYPWARVSYEYLLKSTLSRCRVINNIIRQQKSMAYDVYGFVLALQTWAYEFMPDLGRDCAHIVKTNLGRFPRILRWRVDEFYHYEQLIGYFAPEYAQRLGIVGPSKDEWQHLQGLGLQERHMSPPKLFVAPPLKRKAGEGLRSGRLKDNTVHVDLTAESKSLPVNEKGKDSHVEEIVSNVTLQEIDGQMKALVRKLDVIESLHRRCKCCWKVFAGAVNEEGGDGVEPDERVPNEVPEDEEKESVEVVEAVDEKCEDDGLSIGKKDLVDDLMKPAAVSPKTDKGLEEPDERTSSKRKLRKNDGPSSTKFVARQLFTPTNAMYDPLEATYHHKFTLPFQKWYDTAVKIKPEPETPLPIISKSRVPVSWFDDLLTRRGWLADEHIDALTNEYGLPWVEARQVLGVANVNKNHWVCYAICFESQTVTIYDSACGSTNWGSIAGHFLHMSRYIPWLCSHAGIWEQKKMGSELRDVWEIISAPDTPQQGNNHDFGIMVVKYMECLASNQDISSVDPARCGIWRHSYCAKLFELGREFPA